MKAETLTKAEGSPSQQKTRRENAQGGVLRCSSEIRGLPVSEPYPGRVVRALQPDSADRVASLRPLRLSPCARRGHGVLLGFPAAKKQTPAPTPAKTNKNTKRKGTPTLLHHLEQYHLTRSC